MSLLAEPHEVVLPVSVPEGILMTRVLVEQGVYLSEVMVGVDRVPRVWRCFVIKQNCL